MRNLEKLRPYDLANAKVGDKVMVNSGSSAEVVFTTRTHVTFHWTDDLVNVFRRDEGHYLIAAPLAWASDGEPIYPGDTLYNAKGKPLVVTGGDESSLEFENTQVRLHASFFTKAQPVRTIRIGEFDVPEPVREPLEGGQTYWVVDFDEEEMTYEYSWEDSRLDKIWFKRGLIHLTQEAAELHAKALLSFTKSKE